MVGMGDAHQLDLAELMLPDHAARVLAGGARFGAEARRMRGVAQRQCRLVDDPSGGQVGERHLGRRDEPEAGRGAERSEEHTSELQSLMRLSYAVFCLKKK